MMPVWYRWALGLTVLSPLACAHQMKLETNPVGAEVWLDQKLLGVTPLTVRVPYRPLFLPAPELKVRLQPQYRDFTLQLRRETHGLSLLWQKTRHPAIALGFRPAPVVEIQMVRRHGPIGTWGIAGD
jgi:hypothetical protein